MKRLVGMAAFGAVACSSPKGGSDPGYGVVDPMPLPSRCAGGPGAIHATAAFELDPAGKRVLVIRLAPPSDPTYQYAPPSGDPTTRADAGGLEARVSVLDGSLSYEYHFGVTCNEGPGNLTATVTWAADVAPGVPLTVQITSSY